MNQNGGIHKGGFAVLCHRNGGSESPGILNIEKCIISSENTSSIFVYFSDSLSDDEITKLGEKLKKLSDIMDVEYTSADSAWKEYCKTYLGVENDDLAEGFFHDSPLTPAIIM